MRRVGTAFAALTLCATAATAEVEYPSVGTVFVYDSLKISNGIPGATETITMEIIAVDGNLVVTERCGEGGVNCSYLIGRDLLVSEFGYYGDRPARSSDMIAQLRLHDTAIAVEVYNQQGAVFPLADGQVATWDEDWISEGFNETYRMSLTQTCCAQSMSDATSGAPIWTLAYTFAALGNSGDGNITGLYDTGLNWWVERTTTFLIDDGDISILDKEVLREVIAP